MIKTKSSLCQGSVHRRYHQSSPTDSIASASTPVSFLQPIVSYSSILDISVSARQWTLYEKNGLDIERWTELGEWSEGKGDSVLDDIVDEPESWHSR